MKEKILILENGVICKSKQFYEQDVLSKFAIGRQDLWIIFEGQSGSHGLFFAGYFKCKQSGLAVEIDKDKYEKHIKDADKI